MTSATPLVQAIREIATRGEPQRIDLDALRGWLAHDDPEVRGAAYTLLRDRGLALETTPSLTLAEMSSLVVGFLERTIGTVEGGEWGFTRYEAAWDFASWFAQFSDSCADDSLVASVVARLGQLFAGSDEDARTTLVHGALEHIFERRNLRKKFDSWQRDPVLSQAYKAAALWGDEGGDSPIVGRDSDEPNRK